MKFHPLTAAVLVVGLTLFSPMLLPSRTATLAQDRTPKTARLSGRVVDARTGEPIAKVRVIVSGTDQNTTTDDKGAFTLEPSAGVVIDF